MILSKSCEWLVRKGRVVLYFIGWLMIWKLSIPLIIFLITSKCELAGSFLFKLEWRYACLNSYISLSVCLSSNICFLWRSIIYRWTPSCAIWWCHCLIWGLLNHLLKPFFPVRARRWSELGHSRQILLPNSLQGLINWILLKRLLLRHHLHSSKRLVDAPSKWLPIIWYD